MNTRRQTIWLVSMLSIMVVLSAYYLFTDGANEFDMANDQFGLNEAALNSEFTPQIDELSVGGLDLTEEQGPSVSDADVLREMESQTTMGAGYFTNLQMQRLDKMSEEADRLLSVVNDAGQSTAKANQALEQLSQLEDLHQKMDWVEAELRKSYGEAFVKEENNQWKVIVQADRLEKSEVVSILDLVMNELELNMNQVTVQTKS